MRDGVELRQFAERYTAAWCGGDGGGVAAHFCASGSLMINDGAAAVGRSAIAEAAQGFMSAFPDLRVAMDELRVVGERVEYHWTLTGTAAESGRLVRVSGFESWKFGGDGLIAESIGSFDEEEYQRQLR